jgi:predicted dehydrogenase
MKFLISGLGSIGRRHLRNLLALGEQDIILHRTHRSTLPDDELAPFPVETDLVSALRHQPDAVIVANPTALHLAVAIPAAQAGCHLLIEKPLSHSWEGVDELRNAVQIGGGQVLVAYQFRFHPGLRRIAVLLGEKAIGRPLSARVHWGEYLPNWHPWEDYRQSYSARADLGGGVVLTLSHTLDYAAWLLGNVQSLWAFGGHIGDLEVQVEDTAEIAMRFESGLLASIHMNYNQQPPRHSLEIVGTEGTLRWDNADGAVHLYRAQAQDWEIFPVPDGFERNHMFVDQMRHFIALARGESQPVCSLEDGLRALRLSLLTLESVQHEKLVSL